MIYDLALGPLFDLRSWHGTSGIF